MTDDKTRTIIHNYEQLVESFRHIKTLMSDKPMELIFRPWKANRSLLQNNLMWKWNQEIADYINEHGCDVFIEAIDVHEMLVTKFWGYVIKEFKGELIQRRMETSKFTVDEMREHLEHMEHWTGEREIPLTQPPDKRFVLYGEKP